MPYTTVPYTEYLKQTLTLLKNPGVFLVTAGPDGQANAMTIGWAMVGPVWGKSIMTVMVRPSRYSFSLIEQSESFTVCLPTPAMRPAIDYCGKYSGRNGNKLLASGLALEPSTLVKTPGIAGCPVIYECRIVHRNDVVAAALAPDITAYPRGDYHRMYYGEILAVRALPDAATLL